MDKKTSIISKQIARFCGWVQAAATLLTNIHLPNFFKGKIYQGNGKTVCVPGLNCYSCPAASGACPIGAFQAVVGSSKLHHGIYHLTWCNLRSIYMRFPLSLRMVPGSAAQDTRQKVLYTKAETTALSEIPDSSGIRNPFANVGHQFDWAIPSSANTYALRVYWKVPSHFLLAMQLSGRHLANYLLLKASSLLRLWY